MRDSSEQFLKEAISCLLEELFDAELRSRVKSFPTLHEGGKVGEKKRENEKERGRGEGEEAQAMGDRASGLTGGGGVCNQGVALAPTPLPLPHSTPSPLPSETGIGGRGGRGRRTPKKVSGVEGRPVER